MEINFSWQFVVLMGIIIIGLRVIPLTTLQWLGSFIFKLFKRKK